MLLVPVPYYVLVSSWLKALKKFNPTSRHKETLAEHIIFKWSLMPKLPELWGPQCKGDFKYELEHIPPALLALFCCHTQLSVFQLQAFSTCSLLAGMLTCDSYRLSLSKVQVQRNQTI